MSSTFDLPELTPKDTVKKGQYAIVEKVGTGAFGVVYKVKRVQDQKLFAMKIESVLDKAHVLKVELLVLRKLATLGSRHCCKIVDRGRTEDFNLIIMTLVGKNLSVLKKERSSGRFSIGTSLRIGIQTLEGLEDLHKIGFLHRDIKPSNFSVGLNGELRKVFVLDFGLARSFRNEKGEIRTPRESAGFRGTVRYAALSCHFGEDLARKDDLESWFYQLVEFTKGRLPWAGASQRGEVRDKKRSTRQNGQLLKKCPLQYQRILSYIDRLTYVDEPDYKFLYTLLRMCMIDALVQETDPYDWEATRSTKRSF